MALIHSTLRVELGLQEVMSCLKCKSEKELLQSLNFPRYFEKGCVYTTDAMVLELCRCSAMV